MFRSDSFWAQVKRKNGGFGIGTRSRQAEFVFLSG